MEEPQNIPYPHIRAGDVVLPDCSRGVYRPFKLTNREKRALVKKVATKGLRGIDDFLQDRSSMDAVAERMEAVRKKIEKQLESVRSRRREGLDEQIRRLTRSADGLRSEVQDGLLEDESAYRRFSSEQIRGEILANDLILALEGRADIEDYVEKEGILKRIWKGIKRFFIKALSLFMRFIKFIGSLFKSKKRVKNEEAERSKGAISLPFPVLEGDLSRFEDEMEKKLGDDRNLQKAVNQRLSDKYGYDDGYIQLKSSYDKEWYMEKAKDVLRKEIEEKAALKKEELEKGRKEKDLEQEAVREKERKLREKAFKLEKELENEVLEDESRLDELTRDEMKKELVSSLSMMGYLEKRAHGEILEGAETQWEITEALVEKFSEFLFSELMEREGGIKDRRGRHVSDAGVYEKSRLRMTGEEARMDLLKTLVNARTNHPSDRHIERSDIIVNREVTTSELHAVILVDVSGSMEENMRLEAAKRSVLALTQAVKRENPRNKVDIIKVSTRASPVSLKDVLGLEPRGFTNHQEALALSRKILEGSRSERNLIFLITDGLPEAYVDEEGEAVAGDLEKAMELTLYESGLLSRLPDLMFQIFLLEPEDETFVNSARKIAKAGMGSVIVADPKELAFKVVGEYLASADVLGGT